MPINMQGRWTISVKLKNAAYTQRFVISGAAVGNGTYSETSPPVTVIGDSWVINIQNDPGTGFVDSDMRIKFPTSSGGQTKFDIESNDVWAGDKDYDDLILTCTMNSTPFALDYLIYGNVSYYTSSCLFNPCFQFGWVVIDSQESLLVAAQNPSLKDIIKKYYPEKLEVVPPKIGPMPDPPPFRPIVLPLSEKYAQPSQQALVAEMSAAAPQQTRLKAKAKSDEETELFVTNVKTVEIARKEVFEMDYERVALGKLVDKYLHFCMTGALPGVALRIEEYDRTNAEKAGGPYTGTGHRETLGVCATDRDGNYVFRFSRTFLQSLGEAFIDTAPGENVFVQYKPDIIVSVLDPSATTGISYESPPYWNVSPVKRINICVPRENIGHFPTACQGEHAIQAIGNIFIGAPESDGSRVGYNNTLTADGRITARYSLAGTPQARCAAWGGYLDLYACFLDQPVKYYTIRYRRYLADSSTWTPWEFFRQEYRHPKIENLDLPDYNGDLVGPLEGISLHIDGGSAVPAPAYLNIEEDDAWVFTHRGRKGVISSWIYAPQPGLVEFKIEGYNNAGAEITGAEDTIRLFIDNTAPVYKIEEVTMLAQAGGDCALFTLPATQLDAPLTVKFKANQLQGFLNDYGITVRKGNTIGFSITGTGPGAISGSYVHGSDDKVCSQFFGTLDDITSDPDGVVTANIEPAAGADWLETGQSFCTFAVNLSCSRRVTNGYNTAVYHYGPTQYLLGIQK